VPPESNKTAQSSNVCSQTLLRDAHNLAVWVWFDKKTSKIRHDEKISLLNSEIQAICREHLSTLDDGMQRPKPRPNPTPRVFVEQGNELSRVLWLSWER
jgi:hypothetical protein